MKRKLFLLLTIFLLASVFVFSFKFLAEEKELVLIETNKENLPREFIKGNNELNDAQEFFTKYFSLKVNREERIVQKENIVLEQYNEGVPVMEDGVHKVFDINKVGTYEIHFRYVRKNGEVEDTIGSIVNGEYQKPRFKPLKVKVIQEDKTAPKITYKVPLGQEKYWNYGSDFKEFYKILNVRDNVDGKINLEDNRYVKGAENVDVQALNAKYDLSIEVPDSSGNVSKVNLQITIVDKEPPKILNVRDIIVSKGTKIDYKKMFEITDNHDTLEQLTVEYEILGSKWTKDNKVVVENEIDFNEVGEHVLKITATDTSGNQNVPVYVSIIIEDRIPFYANILYLNLIGLGIVLVAGIITVPIIISKKKNRGNE